MFDKKGGGVMSLHLNRLIDLDVLCDSHNKSWSNSLKTKEGALVFPFLPPLVEDTGTSLMRVKEITSSK